MMRAVIFCSIVSICLAQYSYENPAQTHDFVNSQKQGQGSSEFYPEYDRSDETEKTQQSESLGLTPSGGVVNNQENSDNQDFGGKISVSKRFFTYAALDDSNDDDESDGDSNESNNRSRHKNYDIIFAKAPESSLKSAVKALSKVAKEHQTAVYVLSKTLSASELAAGLRQAQIKPSRPDVHFIKYKTPEEAEFAQYQVKAQYDALNGPSEINGEVSAPVHSVIGSLGYTHRQSPKPTRPHLAAGAASKFAEDATNPSDSANHGLEQEGRHSFRSHFSQDSPVPDELEHPYLRYNNRPSVRKAKTHRRFDSSESLENYGRPTSSQDQLYKSTTHLQKHSGSLRKNPVELAREEIIGQYDMLDGPSAFQDEILAPVHSVNDFSRQHRRPSNGQTSSRHRSSTYKYRGTGVAPQPFSKKYLPPKN